MLNYFSEHSVAFEKSYAVGLAVSVGADLGLDYKAAAAGIATSVTFSTETAIAEQSTFNCPDGG